MTDRLEALADRAEIEDVVRRYARGIDRRDFDLVRACYHPDATDEHGGFSGTVDEYLAWVERLTAKYSMTMHLISGVVVDLADDVAAAESTGVAIHRSEDPAPQLNLAIGFRYLDRFERRDGAWRIADRRVVLDWTRENVEGVPWAAQASFAAAGRREADPSWGFIAGAS